MLAGPIWRDLRPGQRVRPKRGRRQGEVVAVQDTTDDGVSKHVMVVWSTDPNGVQQWATDCLVVIGEATS